MFNLFSLSWRNIWRHRGRSLLSAGAVGFAVFFTLVYLSFLGSMENGMYNNLTESVGHLQVRVAGYREKREFRDLLISHAEEVEAQLARAQTGAEIVVALEVPALIAGENRSRGVLLIGDRRPADLRQKFAQQYLAEGQLPAAGDPLGIALGTSLAKALRVKLGEAVYVYAPGTEGRGAAAYRLVGLLKFPDSGLEARSAFVSLAAAQELAAPGSATRIELHFPFTRYSQDAQLTALQPRLAASLGQNLALETWRQANPAIAQILQLLTPLVLIFAGIFFGLAGLLVVNTIYLSLLERTREFGVIVALGAGPAKVTRMVLLESLLLCGAGAIIGGALGLLLVTSLSGGFSLGALYGQTSLSVFGLPETIYLSLRPADILITLAFALATGLLAAWWPARVAARLEPVEAMRFAA
ncbi:MAG TPA: FtsX-like permease family protein [Meiothermus sp.]|nr:FtsX-like permease family protein [Meiothermus sp.]